MLEFDLHQGIGERLPRHLAANGLVRRIAFGGFRMVRAFGFPVPGAVLVLACAIAPDVHAVDAAAAQQLARQSNCFKCHAVDKKKEGPAYKDVAAKYKGNPDAEARLVKHLTSGEKAKFDDGHEEDHPMVKTKDAGQIGNLVQWILAQ
jgi:cytochrome c